MKRTISHGHAYCLLKQPSQITIERKRTPCDIKFSYGRSFWSSRSSLQGVRPPRRGRGETADRRSGTADRRARTADRAKARRPGWLSRELARPPLEGQSAARYRSCAFSLVYVQ